MGRLFLGLYALLVGTLVAFGIAVRILPDRVLAETEARYFESISRGTFHLAEQFLAQGPQARWPERMAELGDHFGYSIELKPLAALDLPETGQTAVHEGRVADLTVDGAVHLYRRVHGTEYAMVAALEQTDTEQQTRVIGGTVHLIEARLAGYPEEHWPERLGSLDSAFGFPVALHHLEDVELQGEKLDALHRGEIVWERPRSHDDTYYHRVPNSDRVLVLGPIGLPFVLDRLQHIILGCLAVMLAVAVLLWVRPLWRGLTRLDAAAAAFGLGELETRVEVPARSSLARLANTFNDMAARIGTLIASHRELTNAVSHELRTPVSRLRFGLEMVKGAADPTTRERHLAGLLRDVDEIDDLVAELLTYARLERGGPPLELKPTPLLPWLREVIAVTSPTTGSPNLSLHAECGEGTEIPLDPRFMGRAVTNLLRNALRHAATRVVVTVETGPGLCSLHVDDDGPGIPSAAREKVFEPFTRLDTSRDRRSGGHGLGLAIVRRCARLHGGVALASESTLGGARFTLRWPTPAGTAQPLPAAGHPGHGTSRV